MITFKSICRVCSWCLLVMTVFCTTPNEGVEVGSPDFKGKRIRAVTAAYSDVFYATVDDEDSLTIEQYRVSNGVATLIETREEAYSQDNLTLSYSATFSDGRRVNVTATANDDLTELSSATLVVDDVSEDATYVDLEPSLDLCDTDTTHPNEDVERTVELIEVMCSGIVSCLPQVTCTTCKTAIRNLDGLPEVYGGLPSVDLATFISSITSGQYSLDATRLETCFTDLQTLTCTQIQSGINATIAPGDFSGYPALVPSSNAESCPGVFVADE